MQGYGAVWAFMLASVHLDRIPNASNYVSDGTSKLPMTIRVKDLAGNFVTSSKSDYTHQHMSMAVHMAHDTIESSTSSCNKKNNVENFMYTCMPYLHLCD